jgi:hypothetical protein
MRAGDVVFPGAGLSGELAACWKVPGTGRSRHAAAVPAALDVIKRLIAEGCEA